jgi:anti-sigma regulatory factor (Ser/Thr protein kinase)
MGPDDLPPAPSPSWARTIPNEPDAAAQARWFLWSALAARPAPRQIDTAVLLVSELVSNASRHGDDGGSIDVMARLEGEGLHVAVRNRGTVARLDPQADGFGLRLVNELADDWGARATTDGVEVWFEV